MLTNNERFTNDNVSRTHGCQRITFRNGIRPIDVYNDDYRTNAIEINFKL